MCDTSLDEREDDAESPRRMFLHEPGWGIRIKTGSHREFCYTMRLARIFTIVCWTVKFFSFAMTKSSVSPVRHVAD